MAFRSAMLRTCWPLLLACVLGVGIDVAIAAQAKSKSRLFAPLNLGLLEGPDREQWQRPDQIMDALGIADGSIVADLGAGGGWFTTRLARRVGPNGLVYAEDIQPQMIEAIGGGLQRGKPLHDRTAVRTAKDPRLPPRTRAPGIASRRHP